MDVIEIVHKTLDSIKRVSANGVEYWSTRDLQRPLGYDRWEDFEVVIQKAKMSCESTGVDSNNQFHPTVKMVSIGSGAKRKLSDYYASRYGAYLIAMNGNPQLPEIAIAQSYFAVQTRKQELLEQAADLHKRVELRERVRNANKHLGDAAKQSGVQSYALFHAAGYRGLYGLSLNEIKERKGIEEKEELLDRAGREELATNEFRITQAEAALRRNQVQGESNACETHKTVGRAIRETIKKLGGTMPEDLPSEPSIKKLVAQTRKEKKLTEKAKREKKRKNET
jgi:DNA-damage-inducible protein D